MGGGRESWLWVGGRGIGGISVTNSFRRGKMMAKTLSGMVFEKGFKKVLKLILFDPDSS